jgi:hypothetical protein
LHALLKPTLILHSLQGRSAFETPEQVTLEASRTDAATPESEPICYEQAYDERGHPINPRSREHGRALREAQNDVLAAIGVVERRLSTSSSLEDLPSLKRRIERLERLETEDSVGNTIALVSALSENISTWWVGCLRDRILVGLLT